uniref:Uncharacterized protein n=1 Tax=Arundo donax TaxID=35708 RepID=A0A0A9T417_ARUDO
MTKLDNSLSYGCSILVSSRSSVPDYCMVYLNRITEFSEFKDFYH